MTAWPEWYAATDKDSRAFRSARKEHAWLLRAEGMKLKEIGARLNVTGARAREMIHQYGRRVGKAMGRTRWTIDGAKFYLSRPEEDYVYCMTYGRTGEPPRR